MRQRLETRKSIGNGILKAVFAALGIVIQMIWIYTTIFRLGEKYLWIPSVIQLLAFLLVLGLYSTPRTASMKMGWMLLIMAFPFFGVLLYLTTGLNSGSIRMKVKYHQIDEKLTGLLKGGDEVLEKLEKDDPDVWGQAKYIAGNSGYPVYQNTSVTFYDDALKGLNAQLEDLKKAEKFIFMEYHAIEYSKAFEPLRQVLKEKAAEGVEVRLFYDYFGSMSFIGNRFVKVMEEDGIKCRVFNPVKANLNLFMNNRDHRKITVIDGKVGFTGGYNLADEYFHITEPYGHWLDTGIRLEGDAVKSLTVTFLENWNAMSEKGMDDPDFSVWFPENKTKQDAEGYVQPYADSPMDDERVGENVYRNVLRSAKKYAWFITPYLIITDEMRSDFELAAKSGVDVRIITPGIPDKKLVYAVTRSYYAGLVRSGVRIYEYTPGFCHAKQCVCDDAEAVCGTINLDFRSLYHHFENAVLFTDQKAVQDMKKQFEEVFPQCREVTEQYRSGRNSFLRLTQLLLRLAAPLM